MATKKKFVSVDKVAQAFRISEREVQRLVIRDGMPRVSRGEYDLDVCVSWYIDFLHAKVCGCRGPCEGWDPETRNATNAKAERKDALEAILEIAPRLVGKKAKAIEELLEEAIDLAYDN